MGRRKGDWVCGKVNSIGIRCTRVNIWFNKKCEKCGRLKMENFEIVDVEIIENRENIDRIKEDTEIYQEWEGKIKWNEYEFEFKSTNVRTADNGGFGTEIISQKPEKISENEWDELESQMQEFIEEEYRKNRKDWEDI